MSVLKYKDPVTGEVKKVGSPQVDAVSKTEFNNHINNKNNPHGVTAEQVGARPNTWMPTPADIGAAPAYTYGTTELTEGVSSLETGKLYFVYE